MGESGERTESQDDDQDGEEYEPTLQPTSLRRQQRQVALGGAGLSGVAVAIIVLQRYPEQIVAAVVAGLVGAFFVYKLAVNSTFPGDDE
ncbi:hypothetical protein [Halobacteriaceae bacterium SHR40]|uniref:hypothetical protein n=1 Tax=Halovenus amylolytica TaxID=2500550 RepID=UPI000FE397A1